MITRPVGASTKYNLQNTPSGFLNGVKLEYVDSYKYLGMFIHVWGTCVFTCKGCREVKRLVGEVDDLRQMMESMKRIVTGLGLEEKG